MTILTMPRLGETMEDGVVSAWLVQPGQSFKRGDPLIEIETDKTAVEFPALGPGTLTETLVFGTELLRWVSTTPIRAFGQRIRLTCRLLERKESWGY